MQNGYVKSFNSKLRDELLARKLFDTLREVQILIERWRVHYNTVRPHSALKYMPPAPESLQIPTAPTDVEIVGESRRPAALALS